MHLHLSRFITTFIQNHLPLQVSILKHINPQVHTCNNYVAELLNTPVYLYVYVNVPREHAEHAGRWHFASAAGQLCHANIEANTRESEQVLAKNQGWTRKLIFVDYMPHK